MIQDIDGVGFGELVQELENEDGEDRETTSSGSDLPVSLRVSAVNLLDFIKFKSHVEDVSVLETKGLCN